MAVRIAINGFGRIGRNFFRACQGNKDIEIVAVNDLTDAKTLAHILKYDSLAGIFEADVKHAEGKLIVNGREIAVIGQEGPGRAALEGHEGGHRYRVHGALRGQGRRRANISTRAPKKSSSPRLPRTPMPRSFSALMKTPTTRQNII